MRNVYIKYLNQFIIYKHSSPKQCIPQWKNHKVRYHHHNLLQWWSEITWVVGAQARGTSLTLGLLDARSDTAQEIIRRHKYLMITVIPMHLQSCKVSKYLVWSWILSNTVLILNDLEIMVKLAWIHPHNTVHCLNLPSIETLTEGREYHTLIITQPTPIFSVNWNPLLQIIHKES